MIGRLSNGNSLIPLDPRAIPLYIMGMAKRGRKKTKDPRTSLIFVRVNARELRAIKKNRRASGKPMADFIREKLGR